MDINFAGLVKAEFKFIEDKYNFHCVYSSPELVRYESCDIFVLIRFDVSRSYELEVEVGQRKELFDGKERPFSLKEILRLRKSNQPPVHSAIQSDSPKVVENNLKKMSALLSQYGAEFLQNDLFAYKRLSDQRKKECDDYERKTKFSSIL